MLGFKRSNSRVLIQKVEFRKDYFKRVDSKGYVPKFAFKYLDVKGFRVQTFGFKRLCSIQKLAFNSSNFSKLTTGLLNEALFHNLSSDSD